MALDPKKMAAFASHGPKPGMAELAAIGEKPQSELSMKSEDELEGGPGRFGKLIPLLEANAADLQLCCEEINPDALMNLSEDLPDDDYEILADSVIELPDDLLHEMVSTLGGITPEEADRLAAHLEDESIVEEGDMIAAMLVHVGKMIDNEDLIVAEDEEGEEAEASEEPEEEYEEDEEEEYEEEGEEA